ncbi:MAG: nitroreductase family protein [Myxococcota bacterium]|jgi:nitroreductase/NAD-dependent dihydropyrimidine dehydrogenase PreA subunit|nr:nitroreductase family protein [Myxococcota bacterium]
MDFTNKVEIAIQPDICKKDGLCAKVCPSRIFHEQKGAPPAVERASDCVLCGQCLAVCPAEAIRHSRLFAAKQQRIETKEPTGAAAMRDALLQRRSVRAYRDKEIPRELLEEIARTAGYGPTGAFGGVGWVRVVTIARGAEMMSRVCEATVRYMRKLHRVLDGFIVKTVARFSEEARGGLSSLPDLEMRLREWEAGRNAVTYDAPAAIFVSAGYDTSTPHEDCDGALMNMMLAAHAHGLGTCWNGWLGNAVLASHVSGPRELGDLLGIPAHHKVVEAFTVGWPAIRLHSIPERETQIHWAE